MFSRIEYLNWNILARYTHIFGITQGRCHLIKNLVKSLFEIKFKGSVLYIFAVLFLNIKESFCKNRENAFYFTLKALFILKMIKV